MATIDYSKLSVADPVTSAKGAKSAAFNYNGLPVIWKPDSMEVLFEPGTFNGEPSNRLNLVLLPDSNIQEQLDDLDSFVVQHMTQHCERLIGKKLTEGEIHNRYQPCLKKSEKGYSPSFKVKLTLEGPGKTRLWDNSKQPRDPPKIWRKADVAPALKLKGLYFMGKDYGCLWEAQDLMVTEATTSCPF